MMKPRFLTTLAACLALAWAGHAQESDLTVGYCDGKLPEKGDISFSEADSHVSGAIYLPASTVGTFEGNTFPGIRVGLASKLNIDRLTVWVRSTLDGENLAEKEIAPPSKGWNDVMFDSPWLIEDREGTGLYLGYTYHQKGTAFGVAAIPEPCHNAFFVKFGNGEWEDRSDEGSICIEGLVRGEKLPKTNVTLLDASAPSILIVDKGTVTVTGTLKNIATHTVTGYDVRLLVDGASADVKHIDTTLPYNGRETFSLEMSHGLAKVCSGTLTIRVEAVNGADDEDMTDNEISMPFTSVQHDFTHRILVEEFTTEKCPNCPRVGGYMHNALEKDAFAGNVIALCHHAGYYTDWLTTVSDTEYLWLFNKNGDTFAPAMMVDRKVMEDNSPIFLPATQSDMENIWKKSLAEPAFVSLDIKGKMDETDPGKVHVTVEGSRSMTEICDNPVITVLIVEDNIQARSQAGSDGDYVHQHVNRAVNATWGDPVPFSGDDYTYECEFSLSQIWKRQNMQIVAFISNYNPDNAADCKVLNAASIPFTDFDETAAVSETLAGTESEAEYFTLDGLRVNADALTSGLYICRKGSRVSKVMVR